MATTDKTVLLDLAQTLTNKTLTAPIATSPTVNTGVSGTAVLDENDMASDSATKVASQQSIKAYVDSGTVTMTNKTLASPVLNTGLSGTAFLDEDNMASDSATKLASQQSIKAYIDAQIVANLSNTLIGSFDRATFTWNGGTTAYTIKVGPAAYMCKDKICTWATELTTTAIGTPDDNDWYYLYLDYSAITSLTAITNSELIWSATPPTYNGTYRAWMNGDDRAIFMVLTDAAGVPIENNINEFFHNGDLVLYSTPNQTSSAGDTTTPLTVTLQIPDICRRAVVTGHLSATVDDTYTYWEYPDKSEGAQHLMSYINVSEEQNNVWTGDMICDSSREIDIAGFDNVSASEAAPKSIWTNGFYLPIGM